MGWGLHPETGPEALRLARLRLRNYRRDGTRWNGVWKRAGTVAEAGAS